MKTAITLVAAFAIAPVWAGSTVEKCTDKAGKTYYSNTGCEIGHRAEAHEIKQGSTLDSQELRAWAKRSPRQREPIRAAPQLVQQPPKDPFACENARRMYEFEKGYKYAKDIIGRYNEMLRACRGQ